MKKYFYPISSTSLASIFGQACILPASLYKNRLQDIQNKFDNSILLTEHFGCSESDCCLQIVLTLEEEKSLVDVGERFYFYESALPISRIKKIYFKKAVQATKTISNITLSTAFIPNNLVDGNDNEFDNVNLNFISVPNDFIPLIDDVKNSYEKFNRILGAMALMRTAHEEGCNFSTHYIDLLSKFNSFVECQKKEFADINTKFHKVFENHPSFLNHIVDFETLKNEAKEYEQTIRKNKLTNVIDPSNLDKNAYLCYVLYDYGIGEESRRHKIDELILNNFTNLKQGYQESCALYYGYNRGYASFNNQYKKEGKTEIVKYQLKSLLDYYTIESIFEYSFNNKISSELKLFDSWITPRTSQRIKNGEYLILDTVVRDKKKAILSSGELLEKYLSFSISKEKVSSFGYDIIDTLLKPFASFIQNEISNEYEETIQNIKEKNTSKMNSLTHELNYYKNRFAALEKKDTNVSFPNNNEILSPQIKEQKLTSLNEIEFAKKIIGLYNLKLTELKNRAKSKGLKVTKQSKKEDLVIHILLAEKNKDNTLF